MDAIQVIKRDHRAVEDLYAEYQGSHDESKKELLAKEIFDSLDNHAKMKETFFYPALSEEGDEEEAMVREAQAEHNDMKSLIARARDTEGEELDSLLSELMETVLGHVKEEEEELLPDAERRLGARKLTALGEEMEPHSAV